GDERRHLAVLRAADADAALPVAVLPRVVRLRVGDIQHIVFGDEEAARAAELFPFRDEVAILIENLQAAVVAIGEEHTAFRIHRDRVRDIDLARPRADMAPRLDELAILVELLDPRL